MTIRVKKDRIEFVSDEGTTFTLKETGDGFSFNGVIEGTNIFQDGFQGTVAGFVSGGSPPAQNTIEKFPFATDTNSVDTGGDLLTILVEGAGASSPTFGYTVGGYFPPTTSAVNTIQKYPFAISSGTSSDVGDLTGIFRALQGQNISSGISGYIGSGATPPGVTATNTINKFPFATDTNASDIGDTTQARSTPAGQSSFVSGYLSGGATAGPTQVNTIDKFPFATNSNATDVGDISAARRNVGGTSSSTNGYTSGGINVSDSNTNIIDKFPFATDTNATDVGDLTQSRYGIAGVSSLSSGYSAGGGPGSINTIDKFPFATDTNATDVGDVTQGRYSMSPNQD
jgi:hypothetical protein